MELPQGWFGDADIAAYRLLIKGLDKGSFIAELGCWKGRSLCSIADLIKQKELQVTVFDTFEGTENEGSAHVEAKDGNLLKVFKDNIENFGVTSNVVICPNRTDDSESLEFIEKEKFSLVFIDADHSTEAVKRDIINWLPKIKAGGTLAGHDIEWDTVKQALYDLNLAPFIAASGNVWFIDADVAKKRLKIEVVNKDGVTCVICTKDRYFSSLCLTLQAILQQTVKPDYLIIYDDSSKKQDLLIEPIYINIFEMLELLGIKWKIIQTNEVGQVVNHQRAFKESLTDNIWRVDDDVIPEANCLYKLRLEMAKGFKIIAPIVKTLHLPEFDYKSASSLIKDIDTAPNCQLAVFPSEMYPLVDNIEHLHCTFLYNRTELEGFDVGLSKVGHREETIFTYSAFKKGFKLAIVDSLCIHLKQNTGGIREGDKALFEHDEEIFRNYLLFFDRDVTVEKGKVVQIDSYKANLEPKNNYDFAFIRTGLGDHCAFISACRELDYYPKIVACCFPEYIERLYKEDGHEVKIMSIDEGLQFANERHINANDYDPYLLVNDEVSLMEAFKRIYKS